MMTKVTAILIIIMIGMTISMPPAVMAVGGRYGNGGGTPGSGGGNGNGGGTPGSGGGNGNGGGTPGSGGGNGNGGGTPGSGGGNGNGGGAPGSGGGNGNGGGTGRCPLNALKLGLCVDLLNNLVHIGLGDPVVNQCCPLLQGVLALEAALCLCTTIRIKLLNLNIILPLGLELFAQCGMTIPRGFRCPPLN